MSDQNHFEPLKEYLKVPGINSKIGSGFLDHGGWRVKFSIDMDHPLAWRIVQELGHVLNYPSLTGETAYRVHARFSASLHERRTTRFLVVGH